MELSTTTVQIPWSMPAESAFVVVQLKVAVPPLLMEAGVAVNVSIVGNGFTVTVTVSVVDPFVLSAVIM